MPALVDVSNMIPPEQARAIITEATHSSAALQLGTRLPMGTTVGEMPIPKTFPKAAWVSGPGGRKPFTDLSLDKATITAEEVAAIIGIPDAMLDDYSVNLWAYARPLLAEAIAIALDDAVFFGTDAPATFPVGGVAAVAAQAVSGPDVVYDVNDAMSRVEAGGLPVSGHAADITVRGIFRGMRDQNGDLITGAEQLGEYQRQTLFGVPVSYTQFSEAAPNFFTGDWRYLFIGVRQDIRFSTSTEAIIADDAGKVVVSAWQDNVTLMKVWARFGAAIVKPATAKVPGGANPFAKATLAASAPPPPSEPPEGATAARARRA